MSKQNDKPNVCFVLEYGRNWDGGAQERDTALAAIRAVDAKAQIDVKCVSKVRVVIKHDNKVIFDSPQRNLFKKYAHLRTPAIAEMKSAVRRAIDSSI